MPIQPCRYRLRFVLVFNLVFEFFVKGIDRRELIHPLIGTASVDQHAIRSITPRRTLVWWHGRLAHRCPNILNDIDAGADVTTGGDGPDHLAGIGDVNVIVDHDDKLAAVGASAGASGDEQRLFGVPGIALFNGNNGEGPWLATVNKTPYAYHFRDASFFKLLPKRGGTEGDRQVTRRRLERRRAEENRVISIIHPFHGHHRSFTDIFIGKISRPFAERSFFWHLFVFHRWQLAFEHDFRVGGNV